MLTELSIRNLAVIEFVQLRFQHGFHVLTGETGAGKSIIIDALSLAIGVRGSAALVRNGADKTEIEAVFDLPEEHPVWSILEDIGIQGSADESLIIRREVTSQGKSSARLNGQAVNLSMLRKVGEWLVNIHGQHEHQSLLKTEEHLNGLDAYGDDQIAPIKENYQATYNEYVFLQKELGKLKETNQQSLQMQDLYRYQVEEIAAAALQLGEEEILKEEKLKLANSEKLVAHSAKAYELLNGQQGGLEGISVAIQNIDDITDVDPSILQPLLQQMNEAFLQLEDAAYQIREYRDGIEFNPERLEEIDDRMDKIATLRRKYGESIGDILEYYNKISVELDLLEHKDERIVEIQQKLEHVSAKLAIQAESLSTVRKKLAVELSQQIERELSDLHMSKAIFEVNMRRSEAKQGLEYGGRTWAVSRNGWDDVEFMISANPGEPVRSLNKVASGGELSRIMLAMKSIFAQVDRIPVLVFDEVDTGVSGRAAQAIAEKMSVLSQHCQVFSITHLPQVACMADAHYAIEKVTKDGRTYTQVLHLDHHERKHELARMLGGVEVTSTTLSHAEEMLSMANAVKSRS